MSHLISEGMSETGERPASVGIVVHIDEHGKLLSTRSLAEVRRANGLELTCNARTTLAQSPFQDSRSAKKF